MPRNASFTREEVINKGLQLVREKGIESLSARSLGAALGTSSSPIFTLFKNMEEVIAEVHKAAQRMFDDSVADVLNYMPAFKEFGLRQVRFAKNEPHLFSLIFVQSDFYTSYHNPVLQACLEGIGKDYGLNEDQQKTFISQLWTFNCGLAILSTKEPDLYPEERVGQMLATQFMATLMLLKSGKGVTNIAPHHKIMGEKTILDI